MPKNIVIINGVTQIDLTPTTAEAKDVADGKVFFSADGTQTTGTMSSQTIYCGTSAPSSSLGNNGDLYFVMETGTSVELYADDYTASNMNSSSSALANCIGVSAEDGNSTSNVYSSGQNTTGTADYTFDFSSIPSNATINNVSLVCKAHEENSSRSTCTIQCYAGSTSKGSLTTVSGTSNTLYTIDCGSWTRAELDEFKMRLSLGYYGGLIAGATLTVEYETAPQYTGSFIGNASGISLTADNMYKKSNGTWSVVADTALNNYINVDT